MTSLGTYESTRAINLLMPTKQSMFLCTEDGIMPSTKRNTKKNMITEIAHRDVAALHPTTKPLILLFI